DDSRKRVDPRIASEKVNATPTPATSAARHVSSSASVSTTVANRLPASPRGHQCALANATGERPPGRNRPGEDDDNRPHGGVPEQAREAVDERADPGGGREGEEPGDDDVPGDAPANRGQTFARTRPHNG